MPNSKTHSKSTPKTKPEAPLRIGLVRLTDATPYIIAGEMGYYAEAGLTVHLSWELGWASIKHKMAYGQLDAAHALATMPLTLSYGVGVAASPMVALMATSRLGNAITLSTRFRDRGVTNAEEFRQEVRSSRGKTKYTLGVVSEDSTHHILLRNWLKQCHLDPDKDVRIIVVPPGQALRNLRAHTLDGYCVGEPWNSFAVKEDLGWCPTLSEEMAPGHLEKVLMVRKDHVETAPDRYKRLTKVIQKACAYCANPENFTNVARKMRKASILGPVAQGMEATLRGEFDRGNGTHTDALPIIRFSKGPEDEITKADMLWLLEGIRDCGIIADEVTIGSKALESIYLVKF